MVFNELKGNTYISDNPADGLESDKEYFLVYVVDKDNIRLTLDKFQTTKSLQILLELYLHLMEKFSQSILQLNSIKILLLILICQILHYLTHL